MQGLFEDSPGGCSALHHGAPISLVNSLGVALQHREFTMQLARQKCESAGHTRALMNMKAA
jgi:hypothetical protein